MKSLNSNRGLWTFLSGLLIISLISLTCNAQEKKLTREEKRDLRKREAESRFASLDSLIRSGRFVLQADFLQGRSGERINVNSTINFVRVNLGKGTLQVGTVSGMGYNGVGGVTAEGDIRSWKEDVNSKNRSITVRFTIESTLGHYDILLIASPDNLSTATVTGLSSGMLSWSGRIVPLRSSRVFQGQTNF